MMSPSKARECLAAGLKVVGDGRDQVHRLIVYQAANAGRHHEEDVGVTSQPGRPRCSVSDFACL